jgi:CheY-like chemotaxis protein
METMGNGAYLSASRDIIKAHGGHLFLDAAPGRGPALSLYLPVYAGEMDELPSRYLDVIHGSGRILFMDDEFTVRDTFGRAAYGLGYEAELAADGAQAVEMFAAALASGAKFNAVVLDLTVLGGMGAIETLPLLRDLDPAIKVVVSTGYSDSEVDANIAEIGFDALLPKPHSLSELSRILAFATSL